MAPRRTCAPSLPPPASGNSPALLGFSHGDGFGLASEKQVLAGVRACDDGGACEAEETAVGCPSAGPDPACLPPPVPQNAPHKHSPPAPPSMPAAGQRIAPADTPLGHVSRQRASVVGSLRGHSRNELSDRQGWGEPERTNELFLLESQRAPTARREELGAGEGPSPPHSHPHCVVQRLGSQAGFQASYF